ncbi:MAG: DNA mismatch repair protein MutS [Hyphomicrobium sp.]|uniref:DNA mismatch repair protein MutS n=1 Tax=Hyphomicrobium sp. TaxID=82 RepID=UPI0039E4F690
MSRTAEPRKNRQAQSTAAAPVEVSHNDDAPTAAAEATPSMAQYLEIKAANPGSLLWYRMGDFYELFFDDAVAASEALSIVLTKRGKHRGEDIPMCGVPVHRADEYLQRLIRQGFRVAVCEQMEDPAEARKRGAKAVVKRDVVRLVTPGTLTEEALLDAKARNYLTAIFLATPAENGLAAPQARIALASVDISTGEFEVSEVSGIDLSGELIRLASSEVIAPDTLIGDEALARMVEYSGGKITPVPSAYFDSASGSRDLKGCLGVVDLAGFGSFSRPELAAIAAILKYIDLTQMGRKPLLRAPRRSGNASLFIDAASRASLELVKTTSSDKSSTLLAAMDRTVTGAGARELQARISSPLIAAATIEARLDAVSSLVDNRSLTDDIRFALRGTPDLARALPRLAFGRGGPRDLAAVRDALEAASSIVGMLNDDASALPLPPELLSICTRLKAVPASLSQALDNALVDDPPLLRRDGGFIREGFNADLDAARTLRNDSRRVMAELEARYIEETGIKTLRVRHNNILGFYIEVTQLNAKPLMSPPLAERFRHRQTMANAVRFATAELLETEGQIASASERALNLEQEIFTSLTRDIAAANDALSAAAAALAELDVYTALASLALEQGYVRPIIDESTVFDIRGGRHPVVQQALAKHAAAAFIENDCILGNGPAAKETDGASALPDARIWLVTGPNMAGKSTFLRQNALITVMAQMGSYVPARSARIGIVDRLFSRVGASDDLARGRSTFMVEMVETAAILNQATERSLVILDEIGRGTATFDGLSIAWATVEYLHAVTKARALFATHYHELTALARRLDGIANVTMDVAEWQDSIVFLHKVKPGAADRSYGIQVAKLAGLPETVVSRARQVLARLEKADRRPRVGDESIDDLPLFSAARPRGAAPDDSPSAVEKLLLAMHPDDLTPKAALEKLYELKALAETLKKTKP